MTTDTAGSTASTKDGFPVISTNYTQRRPAGWHHDELDEVREASPFTWNDSTFGFWMVNRYDYVREALQMPDVFTNEVTSALGNPKAKPQLLPQNASGLEHTQLRQVLNPWFSPGTIQRTLPLARERCIELIEAMVPKGHCDLTVEFGMQYPTEIFLGHLGLPIEDGTRLVPLVEAMFRGFFGGDPDEMAETVVIIKEYYRTHFLDRLEHPRDPATDFLSYLLQAKVGGEPLPFETALTMAFTIMLAGLDTTRSALGYIFSHLATHVYDRQWLLDNPDRIPDAVEEFIRLYGLLIQDGRFVVQDIDFHGCPLHAGDIVWLGLASANRDPRQFEHPDEFVRDRESNKHLGFGAGAHRCLGAHLARHELAIVLQEWLPRIPHFRLAAGVERMERGGQLMLLSVPLEWEVPA